ncbi:PadR family transcriptional regulator [Companilactobacillus farciminis]|uniref:PadR family transcriptional regulator n=1 Tax=Companilactobacillus farciminis TaxID=1612 RepID=UPI00232CCE5A|nr:PadR family transcriptional regulator [Companilactobacillus farciminis]WCG35761.1 PadR family transcriptional regulator [Companilactobacillus farciminis]
MKGLTELLKGSLEGIVLQHISKGETYGYEITSYLIDLGFEDIVEGTVYTVLLRLQKNGYITSEKRKSEVGPPRKFYRLTTDGENYLKTFWEKWTFLAEKMEQLKEN